MQMDLTNQFLIAMPSLQDGGFEKSVVYICQHDRDGAMGLLINKTCDTQLSDLLEYLSIEDHDLKQDQSVFFGGPVHPENGFVIHYPVGRWRTSLNVTNTVGVTTSKDILIAMANNEGPQHAFLALGYAGWEPGQLEEEIKDNLWLVTPAQSDIIFDTPITQRWQKAFSLTGIRNPLHLSSYGGHA